MIFVLAGASLASTGCSGRDKRRWQYQSLPKTVRTALPEDLSRSDPNERRKAVARLAESSAATRKDVFYVLDAVARTDPVSQIRCIALRGLARYEDDRPVGTLLMVLQAAPGSTESLPADDAVRAEAVTALLELARRGVLEAGSQGLARDLFIKFAQSDADRQVRITATEALGLFQDRLVFQPLIHNLREPDFAIAERAELSLIALTGTTHYFDPTAWETWLANTSEPFAHAGEEPQTTRPAGPNWFEQQERAFRRAIKLGNE